MVAQVPEPEAVVDVLVHQHLVLTGADLEREARDVVPLAGDVDDVALGHVRGRGGLALAAAPRRDGKEEDRGHDDQRFHGVEATDRRAPSGFW